MAKQKGNEMELVNGQGTEVSNSLVDLASGILSPDSSLLQSSSMENNNQGPGSKTWTPLLVNRGSEAPERDDQGWCLSTNTKDTPFKFVEAGFRERPEEKREVSLYIKAGDELIPFNPDRIEGYPVFYEQVPNLGYYDESTSTYHNLCQCIGTGQLGTKDNPYWKIVEVTPNRKDQYTYDASVNKRYDEPDPAMYSSDPVGSRGERCIDCIKKGHSVGKNEKEDLIQCSLKATLYVEVTHFCILNKGKVRQRKAVNDLYDEDGNPLGSSIVVAFNLPKSSLRGQWSNDPSKRIVGPYHYMNTLKRDIKTEGSKNPRTLPDGDPQSSMTFWKTAITTVVPTRKDGQAATWRQIHLERIASSLEEEQSWKSERETAIKHWRSVQPPLKQGEGGDIVPLDPEQYSGFNGDPEELVPEFVKDNILTESNESTVTISSSSLDELDDDDDDNEEEALWTSGL